MTELAGNDGEEMLIASHCIQFSKYMQWNSSSMDVHTLLKFLLIREASSFRGQ